MKGLLMKKEIKTKKDDTENISDDGMALVPKFRYGVQKKPQISQRDSYAKAMNKAQKNGGSNGIGVGM